MPAAMPFMVITLQGETRGRAVSARPSQQHTLAHPGTPPHTLATPETHMVSSTAAMKGWLPPRDISASAPSSGV
jgi:hypothetical protein